MLEEFNSLVTIAAQAIPEGAGISGDPNGPPSLDSPAGITTAVLIIGQVIHAFLPDLKRHWKLLISFLVSLALTYRYIPAGTDWVATLIQGFYIFLAASGAANLLPRRQTPPPPGDDAPVAGGAKTAAQAQPNLVKRLFTSS